MATKRFIINQPKANQGIIHEAGGTPGGEEPYLPPTLQIGKEPGGDPNYNEDAPFRANTGEEPYIPKTLSFGKGTAAKVNEATSNEEPYLPPIMSFEKPGKSNKTNEAPPAKATNANEEEPYVFTGKLFDKKGGK